MSKRIFKNKKTIATLVFTVVLFLLTFVAVFRGQDLGDILNALKRANPDYIVPAVICVLVFLLIQGLAIRICLAAVRQKTNIWHCILYSFTGFFFCCITPFQMGGPPMQAYYMHKEKIPVPVASIILLIIAWMYKLVLVIVGALLLIFGFRYTLGPLWPIMPIYGVGMTFTVGFTAFLALLIFHPSLARRFLIKLMMIGEELHILKHKEERYEKVNKAMNKYQESASVFREHKVVMAIVLVLSFVQRFVLFSSTYFIYRALGLNGTGWFKIVIFQAVIPLCVDLLPIPGGIGLSEFIFLQIFAGIFIGDTLIPGLVLSRGITYYVQLIICAAAAVVTHFYFRWYKKRLDNEQKK